MPPPPVLNQRMRLSLSSKYDHVPDIDQVRDRNDLRLKNRFESIFNKYERDFSGVGDVIDLESGEVIVDNGHLGAMRSERDTGSRHTGSRRVILGPDQPDQDELSSTMRVPNATTFQNNHFQMPQFPQAPSFNQQQQQQQQQHYAPTMVAMPVMMPTQPANQFDAAQMQQYIDQRIAEQIEAYHRSRTSQSHTQLRLNNNAWQTPDVGHGSMNPERVEPSHLRLRGRQSLPTLRRRSFPSDTGSDAEEDSVWRTSGRLVSFMGSESESGEADEHGGSASTEPPDSFAEKVHDRLHQEQNAPWPPHPPKRSKAALARERDSDAVIRDVKQAVSQATTGKQRGPGRPRKSYTLEPSEERNAHLKHLPLQSRLDERVTRPINTKIDDRVQSPSLPEPADARRSDNGRAKPSFSREIPVVQGHTARHRRAFTKDEDKLILRLVQEHGLDWNVIAEHFPDRSPRTLYGRWRKQLCQDDGAVPIPSSKQLVRDKSKEIDPSFGHTKDQPPAKTKLRSRRNSEPLFLTFPSRTRSLWSTEETELLIQLRTIDELSWAQIRHYFPSRSLGCITGHLTHALRERKSSCSAFRHRKGEVGGRRANDERGSSGASTFPKFSTRLSELHQQDPEPPTTETTLVPRGKGLLSGDQNHIAHTTPTNRSRNNIISEASATNLDPTASLTHNISESSRAIRISKDTLRDSNRRSLASSDSSKKNESAKTVALEVQLSRQGVGYEGPVTATEEAYRNNHRKTPRRSLNPRKRKRLSEPVPSKSINKQRTTSAADSALPQTPRPLKASDAFSKIYSAPRSLPTRLVLDDDLGSEDELH